MMGAAMHVKPFGFDRVFRYHEAAEPEHSNNTELLDRIAALEAQIERMRETHEEALAETRRSTFDAALAEARGERETAVLAAIDALHAALEDADQRLERAAIDMRRDAAEAVVAAAETLAGHAIAQQPVRAIDEALGRVLDQIGRGTQLHIRVNPEQVSDVELLVQARAGKERRKLVVSVIPDDQLARGDAQIFWDEGGLAIDKEARRAAVVEEISPLLG